MRLGSKTTLWLVSGTVSALLLLPQVVRADPKLKNLHCVNIQATVFEGGASLGVTTEVLREALLAGIKEHLPQLKIDPLCPNRIFFKVFVQNLSGGLIDGFYGHVAFEVRRPAKYLDTGLLLDARAWDLESYVHGTREKAKTSVLDQLKSHLTQFEAEYKAENP